MEDETRRMRWMVLNGKCNVISRCMWIVVCDSVTGMDTHNYVLDCLSSLEVVSRWWLKFLGGVILLLVEIMCRHKPWMNYDLIRGFDIEYNNKNRILSN